MISGRFEWISIPLQDEFREQEEAATAFFAKRCPECGWLDSSSRFERLGVTGGIRECWRCGTRWDLPSEINAFFREQGVRLPPVRVETSGSDLKRFWNVENGNPFLFDLHIKAEEFALRKGFDHFLCMGEAEIDHLDHQIRTARRVLKRMHGRALLADEVGMGKTIEAGIIIKECLLRGIAEKVLILMPAGLTGQWRDELRSKFDEVFHVLTGCPPEEMPSRLIVSYDRARKGRVAESLLSRRWDILVLDEAQRLKNRSTLLWKFVRRMKTRFVLALSATPVENDLTELYAIVDIVRPGSLGTVRAFNRTFVSRSDPRRLQTGRESTLKSLLADVMVRNRRDACGLNLPRRRAAIYYVEPSQLEKTLYEEVSAYVRNEFKKEHLKETGVKTHMLSLIILQREVTSTPEAVRRTLLRIAGRKQYPETIRNNLIRFSEKASAIGVPTKVRALRDILERYHGHRFVVFSEYVASAEYIAACLRKWGWSVQVLSGMYRTDQRALILEEFRNTASSVLVSTEVGGTGLNLQKDCSHLVNYDLPWNPMRVEQRIGRIDRIGQRRETCVFNLATRGTIEEQVIDILAKKLRMFELVIGEVNVILGELGAGKNFERLVLEAWLDSEKGNSAQFLQLGEKVSLARARYDDARRLNLSLNRIGNPS